MMAKEIRKELKKKFPATKFSVRSSSYSGGGSVDVRWTDFPTVEAVRKVTQKYSQVHRCEASGEILLGANYFVFEKQNVSDELRKKAEERMPDDIEDNPLSYGHWFNQALEELYEEVKGLYEGDHHKKRNELAKKQKGNRVQVKEENKEKPATKKQLFALHCITGMDTRGLEITREQASLLISKANEGNDITDEIMVH